MVEQKCTSLKIKLLKDGDFKEIDTCFNRV